MANQYNPYEAPTIDDDAGPDAGEQLTLATRGSRLAATLVDALLTMGAPFALGFYGAAKWYSGGATQPPNTIAILLVGLLSLLLLVVQCYLLIMRAQTIGKRLFGIRIVNASDGKPTGFGRIVLLRFLPIQLAAWFPLVGRFVPFVDSLLILRPDRRCLHDHIAGTIVVKVAR
jgi:uncharacterized RDD family membrane protein YckC